MRPQRSGLRTKRHTNEVNRTGNNRGSTYASYPFWISPEASAEISKRAAQLVQQNAPDGPNHSRLKVRATTETGAIGVYIPPEAAHLVYLDRGFGAFNMYSLEGKTIPIRGPGGIINFRKAVGVGRRKIVTRDERGRIITSKIAWRHPGVDAMNFIVPSIQKAVREWLRANPKRRVTGTDFRDSLRLAIWDSIKRAKIEVR